MAGSPSNPHAAAVRQWLEDQQGHPFDEDRLATMRERYAGKRRAQATQPRPGAEAA